MKMHLLAGLAALALTTPAQAQSFAAFGDFDGGPGATTVANFVKAKNPDFILTLGDQCYNGTPSIVSQVGGKYGAYVSAGKLWPTLGNHDKKDNCGDAGGNSDDGSAYRAYFTLPVGNAQGVGERYYRKKLSANVEIFSLNANSEANGNTPTSTQGKWLKAALANSTAVWQVVIFHQPAFSSGEHGSTARMQWPYELWGADVVLNGHDHDYERVMKGQFPYFVSGLGGVGSRAFGAPVSGSVVRYRDALGALFFTATSTSLSFQFQNINGQVIDSLALTKGAAAQSTAFDFRTVPGE